MSSICDNIALPPAPPPVAPPTTPPAPAPAPTPSDVPPGRPVTAVDIPSSYIRDSNGWGYIGYELGPGAQIGTTLGYLETSFDAIFAAGGVEVYNNGEIFVCLQSFSPSTASDTFAKIDVDNGSLVIDPTYQTVHVPAGGTVYASFRYSATAAGTYEVTITVGNATATFNMVVTSATPGSGSIGGSP